MLRWCRNRRWKGTSDCC